MGKNEMTKKKARKKGGGKYEIHGVQVVTQDVEGTMYFS
jgi:hypothetical protein